MHTKITEHVYSVDVGALSVFLIATPGGLTLIDAGFPGCMEPIAEAVRSIGRAPDEIHDVLGTHCHPDHAAGLAEVKAVTGARVWMHGADAALVRTGQAFRPWRTAPGLKNRLFARRVIQKSPMTCEPVEVDKEITAGETLPVAGGIKAIGTPGHTLGHLVFVWPGDGGVAFMGDAANNVGRLKLSPIYEDLKVGLDSLRLLADEEFETACFAHGAPIVEGAAAVLRAKWGRR